MKRTKKNYRKLITYAAIFSLISTVGYTLFKMQATPTQVALIATDAKLSTHCVSNLSSFAASGACGSQGFSSYSYSCSNHQIQPLEKPSPQASASCIEFAHAYAKAMTLCGETCKPTPSCIPNPCTDERNCKLMALPDGQSYCPTSRTIRNLSSPRPKRCAKFLNKTYCWSSHR